VIGDANWASEATMVRCGEAHLRALMAALGHGEKEGELALHLYGEMTRHWGQATLAPLKFRSVLTLDHSPLEFSVALSPAGAKLRWVVDCAARDSDPIESREIGVDLCRRLQSFGADLSRVDAVVGALAGAPKRPPMGVGVEPFGGKGPMFKLYFPGGTGAEEEEACLAALEALGLSGAARFVRSMYEGEGARHFLFALDMVPSAEARAKVYVRCANENYLAMARRLARACGEGDDKVAMVEAFGRAMAGLPEGGDFARAAVRLVTTMQFVEGRDTPRSFACNYSVSPVIGSDDGDEPLDDGLVSRRIGDVLAKHDLDAGPYLRAVEAFRRVPLDDEYMMHDYVTLQGRPGASGVSVYLNPRFHAYHLEPDEW
jgi:Tryptophan dimethylallyltransferase